MDGGSAFFVGLIVSWIESFHAMTIIHSMGK
jgi:hypothetical protein